LNKFQLARTGGAHKANGANAVLSFVEIVYAGDAEGMTPKRQRERERETERERKRETEREREREGGGEGSERARHEDGGRRRIRFVRISTIHVIVNT
jgi:hypothetical protein